MNSYVISDQHFSIFMENLIKSATVIAPVAKRIAFDFERLTDFKELRLDYDVTLLPPKKAFFPPYQTILKFNEDRYQENINPVKKILFGVHFYDIKALDMTDLLFSENNYDAHYMSNRNATTIVGSSIQKISPRAFFSSICFSVEPKGHDAFLTKLKTGYLFEVFSSKGEELLLYGTFSKASDEIKEEGIKVNESVLNKCPQSLNYSSEQIASKVRGEFDNEKFWKDASDFCFSCGSCNTTCPTCYCFDVVDTWNVDQHSGSRTRLWDACLTKEFAEITVGSASTGSSTGPSAGKRTFENFREHRFQRFRHRFMRKAAYLNEKLGGTLACVGCGRCCSACTVDIADPSRVINKVMEV
ncbi:MAG: 4Fe-4S dicluster domain-containing protein [Oligoflexia bacterium]|nr:4Fe-4S dicluster domain-containing protein [Oligoflexia bacterium]